MWVNRVFCLFIIYSLMGWIYETVFCTIKGKKWENRGFLYGPVCPIYGVGALIVTGIVEMIKKSGAEPQVWMIFVVSVIGSAVLEYVTSWVLEKIFHAVWWDYSNMPLNLHGRISLFTSLGFGGAGLLIVYVLAPFAEGIVDAIPTFGLDVLVLALMFILASDFTLTVSALHHFDVMVRRIDTTINQNMDAFVEKTIKRVHSFRDRNKTIESVRNQVLSMVKKVREQGKN